LPALDYRDVSGLEPAGELAIEQGCDVGVRGLDLLLEQVTTRRRGPDAGSNGHWPDSRAPGMSARLPEMEDRAMGRAVGELDPQLPAGELPIAPFVPDTP
jgi:hypothetical protein